ncbi:MAG: arginyltransferase [Rhodospirillaceae bacterium]|nr:arginyltransferase [Rhodospirillaceae bacterium]|tara:strand:- start:1331 stop:2083 length:753 start_codon:yes stop_codon:yes gene_type:complete
MFDGTVNPPLAFVHTLPVPCPYLTGKTERRLATDISSLRGQNSHDILAEGGFRRSQHISYRPACPGCDACKAIRIRVEDFQWTKRFRRIRNRNRDLTKSWAKARVTEEQFRLFKYYQLSRHSGGEMALMDYVDFRGMIENSPIETHLIEYRNPVSESLIGAILVDRQRDGYSAVYSFFDPRFPKRSMGNYMVLDLIQSAKTSGINYVYLGYWIEESSKMSYKTNFQPAELLQSIGWTDYLSGKTPSNKQD